jgi:hypothetical protein
MQTPTLTDAVIECGSGNAVCSHQIQSTTLCSVLMAFVLIVDGACDPTAIAGCVMTSHTNAINLQTGIFRSVGTCPHIVAEIDKTLLSLLIAIPIPTDAHTTIVWVSAITSLLHHIPNAPSSGVLFSKIGV